MAADETFTRVLKTLTNEDHGCVRARSSGASRGQPLGFIRTSISQLEKGHSVPVTLTPVNGSFLHPFFTDVGFFHVFFTISRDKSEDTELRPFSLTSEAEQRGAAAHDTTRKISAGEAS